MLVKNGIELATRGLITQSPLAQARHTTICRHILRKTSSCGPCKTRMLTVLILRCELLAVAPRIHRQKMRWQRTGMNG